MKELEENVIGKNFMITYDFSDNICGIFFYLLVNKT